ncbi:MAG: hypothetical protein QOI86_2274 [Actinomycetota bacterium]|nr:hypothetical protein [Actinomycetota bacterium]
MLENRVASLTWSVVPQVGQGFFASAFHGGWSSQPRQNHTWAGSGRSGMVKHDTDGAWTRSLAVSVSPS